MHAHVLAEGYISRNLLRPIWMVRVTYGIVAHKGHSAMYVRSRKVSRDFIVESYYQEALQVA